jgi:hypothetical protein
MVLGIPNGNSRHQPGNYYVIPEGRRLSGIVAEPVVEL